MDTGQSINETLQSQSQVDFNKQQLSSNSLTNQFYRSNIGSFQANKVIDNQPQSNTLLQKQKDLQFLMKMNRPENKTQFQKTLAETLRIRREHQEQLEQERQQHSQPRHNVPKETDSKGSAFRIRPQTPKLNLLQQQRRKPTNVNQKKPQPLERKKKQNKNLNQDEAVEIPLRTKKQKSNTYEQMEDLQIREDLSESEPNAAQSEQDYDEEDQSSKAINYRSNGEAGNGGDLFAAFQDKFFEIIDNEEIENDIELNEIFLAQHLDVKPEELALLSKIELRVDTTQHNLQAIGEILSSLEYLKMNDSIIRCFRDIGTSFKFVRVLQIARCELKEVQGIQAFEHLEELYISYNCIDELFDIGFLEHLSILDLEGNNIKNLDQLFYLRRNQQLNDVNLKYNPVTNEVSYYQKIQENVPRIVYLDDEEVDIGFFERKTEESRKLAFAKNFQADKQDPTVIFTNEALKFDFLPKMIQLGAEEEWLKKQIEEIVGTFEKEPDEEEVLVKAIKNFSREKKASQSYQSNLEEFENRPATPVRRPSSSGGQSGFRRTVTEGFGQAADGSAERKPLDVFRTTTNGSFFKTNRSTAISSSESFRSMQIFSSGGLGVDDDNVVSDLVSNSDQVITGTPLSILRGRMQKKNRQPIFAMNITSGENIQARDIHSLINDFHQEFKQVSREEIREKLTQNSLRTSAKKGEQKENEERKEGFNMQIVNNNNNPAAVITQKKAIRAFNIGTGPIKAERIVLKQGDISFTGKKI